MSPAVEGEESFRISPFSTCSTTSKLRFTMRFFLRKERKSLIVGLGACLDVRCRSLR
jgi:hypothetical protein